MSSSSLSSSELDRRRPLDLHVTIVSAKDLKNDMVRNGGKLKPYVMVCSTDDSMRRFTTKSDDTGSTQPVWNEQFVIPLTFHYTQVSLDLAVCHSKEEELKEGRSPVAGFLHFPLRDLVDPRDSTRIRSLQLQKNSDGQPRGEVLLKLSIQEAPPDEAMIQSKLSQLQLLAGDDPSLISPLPMSTSYYW